MCLKLEKYVYEISAINASEIIKYGKAGENIKTCQFIAQNMCSTASILLLLLFAKMKERERERHLKAGNLIKLDARSISHNAFALAAILLKPNSSCLSYMYKKLGFKSQ